MGLLNVTNTFVDGTVAKASEVNANFQDVEDVLNGNVDDDNLAANAVTTSKIADDAVTGAKVAADAIDTEHLADDAVTGTQLADAAVGTAHLADDAVTLAKMADDSVDTAQLVDASVTSDKIGSDVHPVLGGNTVYSVYVNYDSIDTSDSVLPDGWSVSYSGNVYTITHNLGTFAYAISLLETANSQASGSNHAIIEINENDFKISSADISSDANPEYILVFVSPSS